jgi:O-methyltransferase involved in polyketide biosynthesis
MSETSLIRDVSDTALWVAHYRAEESARPDAMFHDPLAARLVGDRGPAIAKSFGRISRHSAWSIVTRTVMIDDYLREAVANGVDAVLNWARGDRCPPLSARLPPTFPWVNI